MLGRRKRILLRGSIDIKLIDMSCIHSTLLFSLNMVGLEIFNFFKIFDCTSFKINVFWAIRCYRGYCFESLATEDPTRDDGEGIHHVNANVEFCTVLKTKLGAHRILMGAEMDCCDSTDDGKNFYVELKTSREVGCLVFYVNPSFCFSF